MYPVSSKTRRIRTRIWYFFFETTVVATLFFAPVAVLEVRGSKWAS